MSKTIYSIRLSGESSPYLGQHAHKPVDWYPWRGEALLRAKKTDWLVLLSVGYSACHWCDVNDVMTKIEPLLNVLLIPATYRDLYTTGGGLRMDTGDAAATGTTTWFTRPLPGVGKLAMPVEDEEQQEEDREEEEQEQEGAE